MFSPNEILHLVFANKSDTFYCYEALALDLERFLWLKLRGHGYSNVYFVEPTSDCVSIGSFGGKLPHFTVPEKPKLFQVFKNTKAKTDALCSWIMKQLWARDQERSAIVFPLKDFCEYFSPENRRAFLSKLVSLDKRTGILVLVAPADAEGSKSYFLNSPVFEYIGGKSILGLRTAKLCDMYSVMFRSRPESMQFLNLFTADAIHCILSRIFMEEPGRAAELKLRSCMEDYLLQWMNNPVLRSMSKKRDEQLPFHDSLFRDLFIWLKRNDNWNLLASKAMQVSEAGGIRNYLNGIGCSFVEDPVNTVGIRRAADSYAGRCIRLRLKTSKNAESDERERISALLRSINGKVLAPRNREENTRIREMIEQFLSELPAADDSADAGTVRRILFSIDFCIDWINVEQAGPEETAILTVIEQLKNYIDCSSMYFSHKRNLDLTRRDLNSGGSKLTALALRQLEEQEAASKRMLMTYEDAVQASIVKLAAAPSSSFNALAKSLSEEIIRKSEEAESELMPEHDTSEEPIRSLRPEEEQEEPNDEDYVLTDSDFDINPFLRR